MNICSFIDYYHDCVGRVKNHIVNFFKNKPEKGLVENNIFLLGEHFIFNFLGVILFWREKWVGDMDAIWEINLDLKIFIYYLLYTTRYVVQIRTLTGQEKDYQSSMTHHISTILLLTLSFIHYHRIGIFIALTHDIADLILLPAKLCHKFYETRKIKILNTLSYIFFTLFFALFFITRIVLNYRLIYHAFDSYFYLDGIVRLYNPQLYIEGYILFFLLFVNLSIQIFYQIMIINFAYKLSIGEKPKDEKGNEYFKKK